MNSEGFLVLSPINQNPSFSALTSDKTAKAFKECNYNILLSKIFHDFILKFYRIPMV